MDASFELYFAMSDVLRADVAALPVDLESSQSSRRHFVRAAAALAEGTAHCFREMCQVGVDTGADPLSTDEKLVLSDERAFSSMESNLH